MTTEQSVKKFSILTYRMQKVTPALPFSWSFRWKFMRIIYKLYNLELTTPVDVVALTIFHRKHKQHSIFFISPAILSSLEITKNIRAICPLHALYCCWAFHSLSEPTLASHLSSDRSSTKPSFTFFNPFSIVSSFILCTPKIPCYVSRALPPFGNCLFIFSPIWHQKFLGIGAIPYLIFVYLT